MPINIEVIFTGLALFCMNDGGYGVSEGFCKGKLDTVYLVNGARDATVCGRDLDGGHEPLLTFDAKHLLPGSTQPHWIVPGPGGSRAVVAKLSEIELCICTESEGEPGCPPPVEGERGAVAVHREIDPEQKDPDFFKLDEDCFDWVPRLSDLHSGAMNRPLCAEAEEPLRTNELVRSRVRLDKGFVLTGSDWHDWWDGWFQRTVRRPLEMDFLVWEAEPDDAATQSHFPRAMPGSAMWRIPDIDGDAVILLQDCHPGRPQRTLFRLSAKRGDVTLNISNAPTVKHPLAPGMELEHFRWYYRMVDWKDGDGNCPGRNAAATACLSNLPVPMLPEAQLDRIHGKSYSEKIPKEKLIEGAITQTVKCPPINGG